MREVGSIGAKYNGGSRAAVFVLGGIDARNAE
jgi:hypothetical protein